MIKPIMWSEIQKAKQREKNKKLTKEILLAILAGVVFILVMGIAGMTFPY